MMRNIIFFLLLSVVSIAYAQNSDGDAYVNLSDQDDDNDGILDVDECDLTLTNVSNAYAAGLSNFYDGGSADAFLRIRPSDFGYSPTGTQQTDDLPASISKDYSDFFGMPTGSIVVTVNNPNVHATADEFFVNGRAGVGSTTFEVSGTMGVYLQYEFDQGYFPNETRSISVNDVSNLADGSLYQLSHQDLDGEGTTWIIDQEGPTFSTTNISNPYQTYTQLNYASINPQIGSKSITFATTDTEPTHMATVFVRLFPECDTDKDGIPNRLDTDSDGDGCPDAIEANGDLTGSDLTNDVVTGTVDMNGVPTNVSGGNTSEGAYDATSLNVECAQYLPIELISFGAEVSDEDVQLTWSTAMEINNEYFEIERSTDGVLFETITVVAGAGTTSTTQMYSYTDHGAAVYLSTAYYRLKQVDLDGAFTYSDIITVSVKHDSKVSIYPNPVTDVLHVFVPSLDEGTAIVYNMYGAKVFEKAIGKNSTLNLDAHPKGVYFVTLISQSGAHIETVHFTKL